MVKQIKSYKIFTMVYYLHWKSIRHLWLRVLWLQPSGISSLDQLLCSSLSNEAGESKFHWENQARCYVLKESKEGEAEEEKSKAYIASLTSKGIQVQVDARASVSKKAPNAGGGSGRCGGVAL